MDQSNTSADEPPPLSTEILQQLETLGRIETYFREPRNLKNLKKACKYGLEYAEVVDKLLKLKHEGLKKYNLAKRLECLLLKPLIRSFGDLKTAKPNFSAELKHCLNRLFANAMKIFPSDYGLEVYEFMILVLGNAKAYLDLCSKVSKMEGFDMRILIPVMIASRNSLDVLWLMVTSKNSESILEEARQSSVGKNDVNFASLLVALIQNRPDATKILQIMINKIRMMERRDQELFIIKLCTIIPKSDFDMVHFGLTIANELGKFVETKLFAFACLWSIFSCSEIQAQKLGEALGVSFWSELCVLLNSSVRPSMAAKNTSVLLRRWSELTNENNYFQVAVGDISFDWSLFESSFLLRRLMQNGPFTKVVRFDEARNSFHLGSYFLNSSETEEEEGLSSKMTSMSLQKKSQQSLTQHHEEVKELLERKQVLSHHANTIKKAEIAIDPTKCLFVIDTNVLIAQPTFIDRFRDLPFSMSIPVIVLEELVALCDHPDVSKSRNAKAVLAFLDSFKGPTKLHLASLLASGKQLEGFDMRSEPSSLGMKTNDDIILQTCRGLKSKNPVLISDDINMRLKGKAMGITMLTLRGLFELL